MLYLASVVIMLVFFALAYLRLPPQVPLLYSLPNGKEQIVDTWLLVIVPIISLLCIVSNRYIAARFIERSDFTDSLVQKSNIVVITVSTYIFVKIILLVAL